MLRWLTLPQCADLMMNVLLGFLALYFVDVAGTTPARAGVAVAVWSGVGLVGDFLLIPLPERVRGLRYLRYSVWAMLAVYPALLLIPDFWAKIVLVGLLGLGIIAERFDLTVTMWLLLLGPFTLLIGTPRTRTI